MADKDRKIGFGEFAEAIEDYIGNAAGFRVAVTMAMQANDARVDELEEKVERLREQAPGA